MNAKSEALGRKKTFSEKFVNTWRQRHGSNVGLDTPAAKKAYKEHERREKIDAKYK